MLVLRPTRFSDLPAIEHLAVSAGSRLTTLPNNRDHLAELINTTQQSLLQSVEKPARESYHFVLEDTDNKEILGISGIEANVGATSPFYSFRCNLMEHKSAELQIRNSINTLTLCQDYEGSSRLCTFFLASDALGEYAFKLLSLSRLMFIAQHPERFKQRIMLELQGEVDENKQSPFWQALGRHFFNMDFKRANYLIGINNKGFIADLMPRHPVYVPLLNTQAQQAMGKVRPDVEKVAALLSSIGFQQKGYVSIFDGGPTLEAKVDDISVVRQQFSTALVIDDTNTNTDQAYLISNNHLKEYRCISASLDPDNITLTTSQAQQLNLAAGDTLYLLALNAA